jgi:hypothetical protein
MVRQWCQQFCDGHMSVLDDARPLMAASTVNHFAHLWLGVAGPCLPLAPSHCQFSPTLKRTIEECRFTTRDTEAAVWNQDTDFYQQGFLKLVTWWDKFTNVGWDYVEK